MKLYNMNFSADNTATDIIEKSIKVGMHALNVRYSNTGLISKFSMDDYEKENELVKKSVLTYCAEKAGITELRTNADIMNAFDNPTFDNVFNSIQQQSLLGIMARVSSPQIMAMANVATVDLGDSYTWDIDGKGLPVAQRASYLSNVTVDETMGKRSITVKPQQYSLGVTMDYIRIIANDYDWGKALAKVAMGMIYAQYKLIVGLVFDTATGTPLYNTTFTAPKYVKTASDLKALNGGAGVVSMGTLPAWQAISALATSGGYVTKDKYIESAYLQKIFGVDSMIVDQATDFSAPLVAGTPDVLIPENLLVMLSAVDDKPVKLVKENFIRIIREEGNGGSMNKVRYSYFMAFDAALATQAHFALQAVAGI